MARKRRRSRSRRKKRTSLFGQLSDGMRRGLLFIVLTLLGVLIALSAFNLAGNAGQYVDALMALIFGWTRLIAALGIIFVGFSLLVPNSERITRWTHIGLVVFILSFTGLINLLALNKQPMSEAVLSANGGYLGLLLQQAGTLTIGFWGTFAVLLALIAASLLLVFHRTLQDAAQLLRSWRERSGEEEDDEEEYEEEKEEVIEEEVAEEPAPKKKRRGFARSKRKQPEDKEEAIVTTKRRKRVELPMNLLNDRPLNPNSGNIEKNSEIIERTFDNFGIAVEVVDVAVGPTITQYALSPAEGVKLSRIVALQNDLALALAAHPIRIEAPIPGRSLVGIEVPNKSIATVSLRNILESKAFKKSDSDLTVALGMDVSGDSWVTGLEKAPHMLVAGATGSGKSVCLNNLIVSLLYQHGADALKFILVDPKRVELPAYAGIPHLLVPPITKPDEAINALKWTVREMERRLDVLSAFGVRNIKAYNKKADEQMPYIVFVIDELADLMAQASREVEALTVRIAQMARAVGIHLILATQRPSVDVITGTIKANIPTRIAFAVASQTDSRTILDYAGAEKLLGRGDMLFTNPKLSKARRLQGAFLSDKEIKNVINALKQDDAPDYNYDVVESEKGGGSVFDDSDLDPLFEDAVEVLLAAGKASTSLLQRRLKIGYSRAARIMDMLEEQGVIGPQQGSKPREVLIESLEELHGGSAEDEEPDEYEDEEAEEVDDEAEEEEEYEEGEEEDIDEDEYEEGYEEEEDEVEE